MLHTNVRPHEGASMTSTSVTSRVTTSRSGVGGVPMTMTSRPGVGGVPVTTMPQAMQMTRNVQTALEWVLSKQVCHLQRRHSAASLSLS